MSDAPETPRLRQSIIRMLQRMEDHQPGVYREIQIKGTPGAWTVDILKGGHHAALNTALPSIADALTLALRADLETPGFKPAPNNDLLGPLE